MAIGKGFDVLILLEHGVRKPGGLQGDLEYIPFNRDAPEQCFPKVLEMLSVLSPKPAGQSAVAADVVVSAEKVATDDDSLSTPDETWNRDKFERAIFLAVHKSDDAQIRLLDEAYRKTGDFAEDDHAATWQAFIEWARISFGKGGQLKRLKTLADANPTSEKTLFFLGRAYEQFDQHERSAEAFASAMRAAKSPARKAKCASNAVSQFHLAKNRGKVDATLADLRKLSADTPSLEPILAEAVQTIVEADKDEQFTIALLERRMELNPDDHSTRFALAYKQSMAGDEAIALHHYLRIPYSERNAMTWNNIGAAAEQLGLPAKSVTAYERAAAMGETLAMSNLGSKFMNAGFLELAREQCDNALKNPPAHQNIGHLFTSLASFEETERSKQAEILAGTQSRLFHLQQLGRAATLETPAEIGEDWQGPDCALKLVRKEDRISLKGTYERENSLLSALLSPSIFGVSGASPPPVTKSKYSISYFGQLRGRAVIGEMKRERDGASLLESSGDAQMFMILSDDGSEISVVEMASSRNPVVQVFKRVQLLSAHFKG
jgi:tetratricopeptide (TPR) repeat protein